MLQQATGQSIEGLGQAVYMGKEHKEREIQPESKKQFYWLEDEKRFLVDVHWPADKSLSLL